MRFSPTILLPNLDRHYGSLFPMKMMSKPHLDLYWLGLSILWHYICIQSVATIVGGPFAPQQLTLVECTAVCCIAAGPVASQ